MLIFRWQQSTSTSLTVFLRLLTTHRQQFSGRINFVVIFRCSLYMYFLIRMWWNIVHEFPYFRFNIKPNHIHIHALFRSTGFSVFQLILCGIKKKIMHLPGYFFTWILQRFGSGVDIFLFPAILEEDIILVFVKF